jgi:hypothetical protein
MVSARVLGPTSDAAKLQAMSPRTSRSRSRTRHPNRDVFGHNSDMAAWFQLKSSNEPAFCR